MVNFECLKVLLNKTKIAMQTPQSFYNQRLISLQNTRKELDKKSAYYFWFRLLLFAALVTIVIWFISNNGGTLIMGVTASITLIAFLTTIKLHSKLQKKRKNVIHRIAINNTETQALNYDISYFEDGSKYESINPSLAGDFELFGKGSLYQYINRTVTSNGSKFLANKLCFWEQNKTSIEQKQKAVEELTQNCPFMEDFQALGKEIVSNGNEVENLQAWFGATKCINRHEKAIIIGYPLLFLATVGLVIFTSLNASIFLFPLVIAFIILNRYKKYVDDAHDKLGKSAKVFEMYSALVSLVEQQNFKSEHLKTIQQRFIKGGISASTSIKKLFVLLNRFDFRYNLLVNILFNTSLLFDLQILHQLEKWKAKHKHNALDWFDAIAEMDALISFGRFAFNNNQAASYPKIMPQPFGIKAIALGHPVIPTTKRVNNDVDFAGQPKIVVVTGANMAGKSTFLRTIAANLILAHNGAPVCAHNFTFTPCSIVSSINIHDSLAQNESYFYAELLRIREVIDHVTQNPNTLVILDEILRGTNPHDKQTGSMGLIEKLIKLNAFTLIATHDLAIGQMEKKYPNIVQNKCFEVELENDELVFDYKLKEGISQKLNASFLMQKMGIIDKQ